jgi:hypothetical protein
MCLKNNITLKTNNHWTEEEKAGVVEAVKSQPIHTPWEEIANRIYRSETTTKAIYHEQVTPLQHIHYCLEAIKPSDIWQVMEELDFQCASCTSRGYSQPYLWKGQPYCEGCYNASYREEIEERWKCVQQHAMVTGKTHKEVLK